MPSLGFLKRSGMKQSVTATAQFHLGRFKSKKGEIEMGIPAKDYTKVNPDGMHDVKQNARKLSIFYTIEVELSRLIGSWVPRVSGSMVQGPWSVWIGPSNPLNKMNAVCFSHIYRN
jgi:hypothetical protein